MPGSQASFAVRVGAAGGVPVQVSVIFAGGKGKLKTGATLSVTFMVWVNVVLVLPQWSLADHFRSKVYVCGHALGMVIWVKLTVGAGSQLSVAVTVGTAGRATEQLWLMVNCAGKPFIVGAIMS